jgi:hypothetical protein
MQILMELVKQLNLLKSKAKVMKTMKLIVIFVSIICSCSVGFSQQVQPTPSQWLGVQQKMIKSTAYIFQGTVVQQYTKDSSLLTCSVVKISKIFRGSPEINIGSIKVITEQSSHTQDADPGLKVGSTYIIFARNPTSNSFHSITADNLLILKCSDHVNVYNSGARWGLSQYKTIDSLYSIFNQNGLSIPQDTAQQSGTKQ